MGAEAILNDDENSAPLVEIADGDAAPLPRSTTDGLDDESVSSGVRRPRDAGEKGQISDRVRETGDRLRYFLKSHPRALKLPNDASIGSDGR
jgi:hypothetical protein